MDVFPSCLIKNKQYHLYFLTSLETQKKCFQIMRPHFLTEKSHILHSGCMSSRSVLWIQTSLCLSLYAYTFLFTIYKPIFIFLPLSLYFLSHHVIVSLVCMSIPLHLSWFCLCLQYFLSHLPTQRVRDQWMQLQFHQLMLSIAELAHLMSRIALHFVLLAFLWTTGVNMWQKHPSCRLLLSNENITCP